MDRVDGRDHRPQDPARRRVRRRPARVVVAQCGAALAAIHALAARRRGPPAPRRRRRQLRGLLDALGEPHPAFELASGGSRPTARRRPSPRVVHGDFRLGNLIVGPDGLARRPRLGAGPPRRPDGGPRLVLRAGVALRLAAARRRARVLRRAASTAYAAAAGGAGRPRGGAVVGGARHAAWGVICILQASGAPRAAARGRWSWPPSAGGSCENEYDVLRLLGADAPLRRRSGRPIRRRPAATGPPRRPTAPELRRGGARVPRARRLGATTGRVQFHARVAANVLAMVERELALGPAIAAAHRGRLAALGCRRRRRRWPRAIRAGAIDDRVDEVPRGRARPSLDKLAVANPDYA